MTRPIFTLRDLLWLMLVVACLCAWTVDHQGQREEFAEFRQGVHEREAQVHEWRGVKLKTLSEELKRLGYELTWGEFDDVRITPISEPPDKSTNGTP